MVRIRSGEFSKTIRLKKSPRRLDHEHSRWTPTPNSLSIVRSIITEFVARECSGTTKAQTVSGFELRVESAGHRESLNSHHSTLNKNAPPPENANEHRRPESDNNCPSDPTRNPNLTLELPRGILSIRNGRSVVNVSRRWAFFPPDDIPPALVGLLRPATVQIHIGRLPPSLAGRFDHG